MTGEHDERSEPSAQNPIFGTHIGPERAQAFFTAFGAVIEPGEFKISDTSGKPFVSDWALTTRFAQGKLVDYHFYEDTAALADAMRAS